MKRYIFIFFLMIFIYGCGYHVMGRGGDSLLSGINSVAVPVFKNDTYRAGVEVIITGAVVDELLNSVSIADSEVADAAIEGSIKNYKLDPVSYSSREVVREYRLTVILSVRLIRKSDSKVLWRDDNITDYEDFLVDTADVMATKDAEKTALRKIARDTARLIKEHILEGF